jgi:hypothetical protein
LVVSPQPAPSRSFQLRIFYEYFNAQGHFESGYRVPQLYFPQCDLILPSLNNTEWRVAGGK